MTKHEDMSRVQEELSPHSRQLSKVSVWEVEEWGWWWVQQTRERRGLDTTECHGHSNASSQVQVIAIFSFSSVVGRTPALVTTQPRSRALLVWPPVGRPPVKPFSLSAFSTRRSIANGLSGNHKIADSGTALDLSVTSTNIKQQFTSKVHRLK